MQPNGDFRIDFSSPVNFPTYILDKYKDGGAAFLSHKVTFPDGTQLTADELTLEIVSPYFTELMIFAETVRPTGPMELL